MVKKSLQKGDAICQRLQQFMNCKRGYYPTLAKLMHVWRDNCKTIFVQWELLDAEGAKEYTYRRPPRPAGRWGVAAAIERHALAPPIADLRLAA